MRIKTSLFFLFFISLSANASKNQNYDIGRNIKLTWNEKVDLDAHPIPKMGGVWLEGHDAQNLFSVWVARTHGKTQTFEAVQKDWEAVIAQNKKFPSKKVSNKGCQQNSKTLFTCQRLESETVQSKGKDIIHHSLVKMTWNKNEDIVLTKYFAYENAKVLTDLEKNIYLEIK